MKSKVALGLERHCLYKTASGIWYLALVVFFLICSFLFIHLLS
jgi:hypothetical protein